jgi:hypothetical protein
MLTRVIRKARNVIRRQVRFLRDGLVRSYLSESTWRPGVTPYIGEGAIAKLISLDPSPEDAKHIGLVADKALQHEFNLLGSGWLRVAHEMKCPGLEGHRYDSAARPEINKANAAEAERIQRLLPPDYVPIDWHRDFKSGYRWSERTWYERIPIGHLPGVDVKLPWELGRLQHLPCLALQFAHRSPPTPLPGGEGGGAKRQVYAVEFRNQVLDFLAANPPRWGVNWRCTMDVAIRVANMIVAFDLFRAAGAEFDEEFVRLFWRSILEHALHIRSNLEWHPVVRGNHYLCDIVGLLCAAAYLPATATTRAWLEFAVAEVGKELAFQFHLDGGNFEASTFYHRLSSEAVWFAVALIDALPRTEWPPAPDWQREWLERVQRFGALTENCRVGDNDSGRIFQIPSFPGSAWERTARGSASNASRRSLTAVRSQPEPGNEEFWHCDAFPLFGLYRYRSPRFQVSIRCGPVGQNGNGGHAHNDQLSFELSIDDLPFIVDPGTYVYSPLPEARNIYRSTAMHNTLAADGLEQNVWQPGIRGLFQLADRCRAQVLSLGKSHFEGVHHGFSVPHRRRIDLFRETIRGLDECAAGEKKTVYFHLAPEVQAEFAEPGKIVRLTNGDKSLVLHSDSGRITVQGSVHAPAYGVQASSRVVVLESAEAVIRWAIIAESEA